MAATSGNLDRMELVDESPWSVHDDWDWREDKEYTWVETRTGTTVVRDVGDDKGMAVLVSLIPELLTVCRLEEAISFLEDLIAIYDEGTRVVKKAMKEDEVNPTLDSTQHGKHRREALESANELLVDYRDDALRTLRKHDVVVNIVGDEFIAALESWSFDSFQKGDVKKRLAMLEMRSGSEREDVLLRLDESYEGRGGS